MLFVPWGVIDEALAQAGSLAGRVVVDTTNQFGRGAAASLNGHTAVRRNADRIPGASYAKCFNTLTTGFQAAVATRTGDDRVVQWIAGSDTAAKAAVAEPVEACGYVPIDLAGPSRPHRLLTGRLPGVLRLLILPPARRGLLTLQRVTFWQLSSSGGPAGGINSKVTSGPSVFLRHCRCGCRYRCR